ncbi:SigE family RNA polymerase sigma factor [Actinacidiphila paucisporea]|uniref:RNA polymerase sigma-70 factor, sigma-E family n=1 Tax=Actinacidiphila paucisporea TaxID=310782 RepID=A0A1M7ISS8_9ACTN|nr:SigE family RNA polymerase sigma factor [Actinacidiphila paucisporea]SHM43749.1 RNA polymerase sigma-70 factor, sigma-E family [Actinacidiphila paucisporea]
MRQAQTKAYIEFAQARTRPLYRSAWLLTGGDSHLAEDLVQETLSRMYVVWGRRSDKLGNPAAYAQTVLVRNFLMHRRRRATTTERLTAEPPEYGRQPAAGGAGDVALRMTLLDALTRLSPKDRAVLVLRYWEDRSVEDTAEALQASSGAIRTRTVRALERLRAELGEQAADLVPR